MLSFRVTSSRAYDRCIRGKNDEHMYSCEGFTQHIAPPFDLSQTSVRGVTILKLLCPVWFLWRCFALGLERCVTPGGETSGPCLLEALYSHLDDFFLGD